MKSEPFFSIVTPINKVPPTFHVVVEALRKSSFKDFEWKLVLNGSGVRELEAEIVNYDVPRAVFLRSEKIGVSAARNAGILSSRGKYILFLDADDVLDICFMEYMYALLSSVDGAYDCVATSGFKYQFHEGVPSVIAKMNLVLESGKASDELVCLNQIGSPTGFVVKNDDPILFDEQIRFFEDYTYFVKNLAAGRLIYTCDKCRYFYYVQDDISERLRKYDIELIEDSYSEILKLLQSLGLQARCKKAMQLQLGRLMSRYRGNYLKFYAYTLSMMIRYPRYAHHLIRKNISRNVGTSLSVPC